MLAIATESIVKLMAFLAVGIFVTFVMFHGPFDLFAARAATAIHRGGADPRAAIRVVLRHDDAVGCSRSFSCRGNSMSRWSRIIARPKSAAPPGCSRSIWYSFNLFVLPIAMAGLLDVSGRPFRQRHVRGGAAALPPIPNWSR